MSDSPLQTRGSLFDEKHENGILIGYVLADGGRKPVVDLIRRDANGKITRVRHDMEVVIATLEKLRHA